MVEFDLPEGRHCIEFGSKLGRRRFGFCISQRQHEASEANQCAATHIEIGEARGGFLAPRVFLLRSGLGRVSGSAFVFVRLGLFGLAWPAIVRLRS